MELVLLLAIAGFVLLFWTGDGKNTAKEAANKASEVYEKYAPYTFKQVTLKTKELGFQYTKKQYIAQIILIGGAAGGVSYLYFYSVLWSALYVIVAILFIPYLAFKRSQRLYSEYIFEQIQIYTTNVIMEFNTTQSFVKSLEGVRDSGILEDPVLHDLSVMIDMSYKNGTIDESIEYFNSKYPFYMVKNMHQLFLQITKEGARDSGESLENMAMDIDALVEGVYRDQMDRKTFYRKFLTFGGVLFLLVLVMQLLLGKESYIKLLDEVYVVVILHAIIIINIFHLVKGIRFYNEDVGVE